MSGDDPHQPRRRTDVHAADLQHVVGRAARVVRSGRAEFVVGSVGDPIVAERRFDVIFAARVPALTGARRRQPRDLCAGSHPPDWSQPEMAR
jgi:hypothetical protein